MTDFFASPQGSGDQGGCIPLDVHRKCRPNHIIAHMPTKGVFTIYSVVGDVLPIFCMVLSVGLLGASAMAGEAQAKKKKL